MKKNLLFILVVLFGLVLVGCKNNKEENEKYLDEYQYNRLMGNVKFIDLVNNSTGDFASIKDLLDVNKAMEVLAQKYNKVETVSHNNKNTITIILHKFDGSSETLTITSKDKTFKVATISYTSRQGNYSTGFLDASYIEYLLRK